MYVGPDSRDTKARRTSSTPSASSSRSWTGRAQVTRASRTTRRYAIDTLISGEARYWLTAELPVPEAQEIAATVEEAPREA